MESPLTLVLDKFLTSTFSFCICLATNFFKYSETRQRMAVKKLS